MSKNKALLIGINYINTSSALNGCINDVKNVRLYLSEKFKTIHEVNLDNSDRDVAKHISVADIVAQLEHHKPATPNDDDHVTPPVNSKVSVVDCDDELTILILTDDQSGRHLPTRQNILDAFQWLVKGTRPGDKRFLHYSGHGSNVVDRNNDEADGKDECICPLNYATAGMIIDDDIRQQLINSLPKGSQLHIIIDACHSQSCCDIVYNYKCESISIFNKTKQLTPIVDKRHTLTDCDVVCWSGCLDTQTSADAFIKGAYAGALTSTFMEIMRDKTQNKSYIDLYGKLLELLSARKYSQIAQLSSGIQLDVTKQFDLF